VAVAVSVTKLVIEYSEEGLTVPLGVLLLVSSALIVAVTIGLGVTIGVDVIIGLELPDP
jgi:hypothetical protein